VRTQCASTLGIRTVVEIPFCARILMLAGLFEISILSIIVIFQPLRYFCRLRYTSNMGYELGILGAGNMAEAIVRGVLVGGQVRPEQIIAADVSPQRRELFEKQLGVTAVEDNRIVAGQSAVLLLSVKPQMCKMVLEGIAPVVKADATIISIMAGISSKYIDSALGGNRRVVRTMPNTPMLVGEGMAAIARGEHANDSDVQITRKLFEAAASVIEVNEDQIDAVTAVSGSGPAYFFFLVEQMIQGGINLGLSSEQAGLLAAKTAMGAAKMLTSSSDSPTELRRKVTSPGGTTQAAITTMEAMELPAIVQKAMQACADRSKELGL
jgi:pyrroline-5-carboxylate reductase